MKTLGRWLALVAALLVLASLALVLACARKAAPSQEASPVSVSEGEQSADNKESGSGTRLRRAGEPLLVQQLLG